jgi:hypothetical protein
MLFFIAAGIALVAILVLAKMRAPGGANTAELGCMSEQWLAEHRASHSS